MRHRTAWGWVLVWCLAWRHSQQGVQAQGSLDWIKDLPPAGSANQTCTALWQEAMLAFLYQETQGKSWYNNSYWLTNSNCTLPNLYGNATLTLPRYCCWYGVTCCIQPECPAGLINRTACDCNHVGLVTVLRLSRNNLVGRMPNNLLSWISCELKHLDLTFNVLSGQIQPGISLLTNLQTLGLGYNNFSGSLPAELGSLPKLKVLDVTNNNLEGTVPSNLCRNDATSSITDLLLSNNRFNGTFNINTCESLVLLDVANNNFTGSLPTFSGYGMLHIARFGNNSLSGSIPPTINVAPWLSDLDVANNQLSGSIPASMATMRLLSLIRFTNNQLTGTIPPGLFSNLGTLSRINLANNMLYGTIPPTLNPVPTVTYLDFSMNYLVGTIPDFLRQYALPGFTVNLGQNFLSCCGTGAQTTSGATNLTETWQAYGGVNWDAVNSGRLLPPWLDFSSFHVPVENNKGTEYTSMRCPALRRAGAKDDAANHLDWYLDPDYYMYHGCTCEQGYELVNKTQAGQLPVFACEAVTDPWYIRNTWALVILVLGCTLLPLAILLLSCYRRGARPACVQQFYNLRKRVQGEPKEGVISVVTTDIEGYSELMKREPELMGKGLRIHNYCIDKARWQFYGFTMEQEGDSFTIAFHEPFDAVAFCLQAQLLLNRVEWPERLLNQEGGLPEKSHRKGSKLSAALQGAARILMGDGTLSSTKSSSGAADPVPSPTPATVGSGSSFPSGLSLLSTGTGVQPTGASSSSSAGGSLEREALREGSQERMGSRLWRGLMRKDKAPAIPEDHAVAAVAADSTTTQRESSTGSVADANLVTTDSMAQHGIRLASGSTVKGDRAALFNGLRVRMGIVTGRLEKGGSLRASPLMDRAKMVSDAGSGGQILMDGPTFREVKARLVELGAVDHNGLSLSKMNLSQPTLMAALCCSRRRKARQADVALVLDMGQYVHSSTRPSAHALISCPTMAHSAASFRSHATSQGRHMANELEQAAQAAVETCAAAAATAAATGGADEPLVTTAVAATSTYPASEAKDNSANRLHMYQILSPRLSGRAHFFGSKLALKDEWICVDPPYFDAPGAMSAALGLDGNSSIPAMTMVFAAVEGVKDWKIPGDKVKKGVVQRLIRDAIINTLMAVKGGYMCRMQDDELKYMIAFPEPEDAAKWCLLLQDALLWQEWPEWVLRHERLREEVDDRGEVVFRGPRLRMGLCHGQPRAIVPDHMGRADYHGACINSAARFMDAAAHGGMVVCEEETALTIISRWNAKSELLRTVESTRSSGGSRPSRPSPQGPPGPPPTPPATPPAEAPTTSPEHVAVSMAPETAGAETAAVSIPPPNTVSPFSNAQHVEAVVAGGGKPSETAAERSGKPRPFIEVPAPAPRASSEVGTPTLVVGTGAKVALAVSAGGAASEGGEGNMAETPTGAASQLPATRNLRGEGSAQHSLSGMSLPSIKEMSSVESGVDVHAAGAAAAATAADAETAAGPAKWHDNPAGGTLSTRSTHVGLHAGDSANGAAHSDRPSASSTAQHAAAGGDAAAGHAGGGVQRGMVSISQVPSAAYSYVSNQTDGSEWMQRAPSGYSMPFSDGQGGDDVAGGGRSNVNRSPSRTAAWVAAPVSGGILKYSDHGSAAASEPQRRERPKGSVRITLPEGVSDRPSPPQGSARGTGGGTTAGSEKDRERPSAASNASTAASTYRTTVHAYRLGSYRFKGSPDDVPMAQLLMDALCGRRFPHEPPKGKGNRTKEGSGLLATAFVELPNIARRYFWLWRAHHELVRPSHMPTSRTSTFKGWAANIISASRTNSMQLRGTGGGAGVGAFALGTGDIETPPTAGTGTTTPQSPGAGSDRGMARVSPGPGAPHGPLPPQHPAVGLLGRSKNLLQMMRSVRRRSPTGASAASGVRASFKARAALESAPSEISMAAVEREIRRNTSARGFGSVTAVTPPMLDEQLHPRYRSDSISSFIVAAEEGLLQEQLQQQGPGSQSLPSSPTAADAAAAAAAAAVAAAGALGAEPRQQEIQASVA